MPRGFLSRYIPANQHVLRAAAAAAGARHGSTMDVVEGVWGRVTPAMFVAACQQVGGVWGGRGWTGWAMAEAVAAHMDWLMISPADTQ